MCSRFEIKTTPETIRRRFRLKRLADGVILPADPVRRPTDPVLAVTTGETRALQALRWGLSVDWDAKPLINARAETLTQKPTFRPLLAHRCLVPASAYFEWRKDAATGKRLKNRLAPPHMTEKENEDEDLIAFAGLFDPAQNAVTIVTCAPSPDIAHIHSRMPVILRRQDEDTWADARRSFGDVAHCLVPFPGLIAHEDTPPPPAQADLFG